MSEDPDFNTRFQSLLDARREEYKTYTPMYCPVLRQYVHFSMRGFNHLRFKVDNTPRNPKEAMYKLGLLPLARPAIYHAKSAEYERRMSPVGGTRKPVLKEMEYWGLTTVVGKKDVKVRVILRKLIESDQVHFWSIMKLGQNQKIPSLTDEII